VRDLFIRIWVWSLASEARNWASHAVLAVLLALLIGSLARMSLGPVVSSWMLGSAAAGGFYVLKEAEKTLLEAAFGDPIQWRDNGGDALFPALALVVLEGVRHVVR
jgi:hypothetical protein